MQAFLKTLVALVLVLGVQPVTVAQAQNFSPKQLGSECLEIYRDWLTQKSPKAFAVADNNVDCGASWAHDNIEDARADAMDRCTGTGQPGCEVLAEDATPLPSVVVGEITLIGDCVADYENWLEQGTSKAMYATADGRSCGAAWNYGTLQQARKEARAQCIVYNEPCQEIGSVE